MGLRYRFSQLGTFLAYYPSQPAHVVLCERGDRLGRIPDTTKYLAVVARPRSVPLWSVPYLVYALFK